MPWMLERILGQGSVERLGVRCAGIIRVASEVTHLIGSQQLAPRLVELFAQPGSGRAGARVGECERDRRARTRRRTWSSRAGARMGSALLATMVTPSRTRGPGSCSVMTSC
jgi:hypothetical protein